MLRKIVVPTADKYMVRIPREYLNRPIEILIMLFDLEYEPEPAANDDAASRFWATFGSWQDDRAAEEIIADIYTSRTSLK